MRPVALVCSLVLLVAAGCQNRPRNRIGALPYPGPFTLFELADPDDLGTHHYGALPSNWTDDEERGIVYTKRAGFLDISHMRIVVDWTKYITDRVTQTLRKGESSLTFKGDSATWFHMTFDVDALRGDLSDEAWAALIPKIALRVGQRVAYVQSIWHEIATWYDYRWTIVVSERRSAFTYDDMIAHVVAIHIAERAIRSDEADFDIAVTAELDRMLEELEAVSVDEAREATMAVEGLWWSGGRVERRRVDVEVDGRVTAWLVDPESGEVGEHPVDLDVPSLADVDGKDIRDAFKLVLEPWFFEARHVRAAIPDAPKLIEPAVHYPLILEKIHGEMIEEFGPDVFEP